jgi:hypothetical protein
MSLWNRPDRQEEVRRRIEAVAGPLRELRRRTGNGLWRFEGSHRGRPVRISVIEDEGHFSGVCYEAWLGGRPLLCFVEGAYVHHLSVPRVVTGDPSFDGPLRAWGAPVPVVHGVLDGPTRSAFVEHHRAGRAVRLWTEEGWLRCSRSGGRQEGPLFSHTVELPEPHEIRSWLDTTLAMADRLVAAFDAAEASGGPAWRAEQEAFLDGRAKDQRKLRHGVLGAVGLLIAAPMLLGTLVSLAVMAWLWWAERTGSLLP